MTDAGAKAGRWRVGIDIGGTFTDILIADDVTGRFVVGKALTTPRDPSAAIETVLLEALGRLGRAPSALDTIVHGTTLVTNAVIERTGAKTALLATEGFRDAIEIGREQRYELYDLMIELPRPLVPRHLRFDVPERTLADGTIVKPVDQPFLERLARELASRGVGAVAVAFLNSYANPESELTARDVIHRAAPALRVSISSEVAPEIREYERTSTTVVNVYVQGRVEDYLRELEARLDRLGARATVLLMLSSGGLARVETAIRFPVRLLESGPAAGALAAARAGSRSNRPDLLSFDMGGTTAKFCVIAGGEPLLAQEFEFDRVYRFKKGSGLPAKVPVIEMIEIGAGGGSIARVDALGLLKVGPDSAGADPGPACYGRGGSLPTVTDADLVLGYLDPNFFLGGRIRLDVEAARRAIEERVARPLGLGTIEAAWGIHQVVNQSMANAARVHVLERGHDPRRFPLFAFGGAGPVHGDRIARALGSPAMIAPLGAGVLSTAGFLTAPLGFDFVRSWRTPLMGLDYDRAEQVLGEMEARGTELLRSSGVEVGEVSNSRSAEMRYQGQGHEIRVPLPVGLFSSRNEAELRLAFEARYRELYGRLGPPVPIEVVNWRVVSTGPVPRLNLEIATAWSANGPAIKSRRQAYFPESGGFAEVTVYDRYRLRPGDLLSGPAIVEENESTVVIGPGARAAVDEQFQLVVTHDA